MEMVKPFPQNIAICSLIVSNTVKPVKTDPVYNGILP